MSTSPGLAEVVLQAARDARPLVPMYIHLIISALFPIWTGAHASLSRPASAAKAEKKNKDVVDDDDEEEKVQKMEGMSNKDAFVLPITAGLVLAGLYFLIKRYGADLINFIMGWYFSVVGVFSVAQIVNDGLKLLCNFVYPDYYASGGALWRVSGIEPNAVRQDNDGKTTEVPTPPILRAIPLPQSLKVALWNTFRQVKQKYKLKAYVRSILQLQANVTLLNLMAVFTGFATIIYVNTVSKVWFLTNLQGFAVSYSALQLMSPTSFATGSLILGALFCYDIWAVFFTPLMVTVAKNLDQPIKLVFPRPDQPSAKPGEPPEKSFSMLGLGDIVLPGIMIGLALRFDLYMFYIKKQKTTKTVTGSDDKKNTEVVVDKAPYVAVTGRWGDRFWTHTLPRSMLPAQLRSSFPKPYFTAAMTGYVIGMLTTLGVMTVFQHAQPALLYLVPGVLASLWGTALVRRELKEMWEYTEALNAEQLEEEEKSKPQEEVKPDGKGLFERLWHEIWSGSHKEKDAQEKKASADGQSKESSSTNGTIESKKDGDGEDPESSHDDVIIDFSLTRYKPKVDSGNAESNKVTICEPTKASAAATSSATADEQANDNEQPRYRTRSLRSAGS